MQGVYKIQELLPKAFIDIFALLSHLEILQEYLGEKCQKSETDFRLIFKVEPALIPYDQTCRTRSPSKSKTIRIL